MELYSESGTGGLRRDVDKLTISKRLTAVNKSIWDFKVKFNLIVREFEFLSTSINYIYSMVKGYF